MPNDMRRVILELPPEYPYKESELFEYVSFKKAPKVKKHYSAKIGAIFEANFRSGNKLFTPPTQSFNRKNIVVKNIGNMKKAHLKNSINYTLSNSENNLALDWNGELVNADEILKDWQEDFSSNPNTNEAMHLVFSVCEAHSQSLVDILTESARQTMQSHFPEYKWVMVAHSHQNNPHIHILVNKTNIFTKKKMHFKSKSEISQFFNELREDFKQNLFVYSGGKLDYSNEVRFDKRFRQEMIDNKIADLEVSNLIQEPKKELEFMATYKKAVSNFSSRHKGYSNKLSAVEQSLKKNSIYLKNIYKKVCSLEEQGINPTNLIQRQFALASQIESDRKEKERLQKELEQLTKGMKYLLDWNDNFKIFTKNFVEREKQKAFIKSFKGYERYLSIDLSQKLRDMGKAIEMSENSLKNDFERIDEGVIKGISDFDEKSNVFKLCGAYSKLVFYKGIVSSIDFSDNASLRDKKQSSIDTLRGLEKDIISLIQNNLKNILAEAKQTLSSLDEAIKDYTLDNMALSRAVLKQDKKLRFYESSLKAIMRFDKRYELGLISKELKNTIKEDIADIKNATISNGLGVELKNMPLQNVEKVEKVPQDSNTIAQKAQVLPKNANAPSLKR